MPAAPRPSPSPISDEAVKAKTGKAWKAWFTILDRAGSKKKTHKEIAAWLHERHDLSSWWSQMVTVRYEQERGLRVLGQTSDGEFQASVTRTVPLTREEAFAAFTQARHLNRWATTGAKFQARKGGRYSDDEGNAGEIRSLAAPERVRFTWDNPKLCPGTVAEVRFTEKGDRKTSVNVTHEKLSSSSARERMRRYWTGRMDALKAWAEG